jgi:hypothetical protein
MINYHHITIHGSPLCECEGHHAGLLSQHPHVTYQHNGEPERLACAYLSKAMAQSARREVAKVRVSSTVKVVPGQCPAAGVKS